MVYDKQYFSNYWRKIFCRFFYFNCGMAQKFSNGPVTYKIWNGPEKNFGVKIY